MGVVAAAAAAAGKKAGGAKKRKPAAAPLTAAALAAPAMAATRALLAQAGEESGQAEEESGHAGEIQSASARMPRLDLRLDLHTVLTPIEDASDAASPPPWAQSPSPAEHAAAAEHADMRRPPTPAHEALRRMTDAGSDEEDAAFKDSFRAAEEASERDDEMSGDASEDTLSPCEDSDRPTGALSSRGDEQMPLAHAFPTPPQRAVRPQAGAGAAPTPPVEMGLTKRAQLLSGLLPSVVGSAAASGAKAAAKAFAPPGVPKWLADPMNVQTERLELHADEQGRLQLRSGPHGSSWARAKGSASSEADEMVELRLLLGKAPQVPQAFHVSAGENAIAVE